MKFRQLALFSSGVEHGDEISLAETKTGRMNKAQQ